MKPKRTTRPATELDRQAARYARKIRREALRDLAHRRALVAYNPIARQVYRVLGMPCGAWARSSQDTCKRPGTGAGGRCRQHGGTRRQLSPAERDFMHGYYARQGRRGAEIRWARVRGAGGLSGELREFLAECGRDGGRIAGRGRPKQ